MRPEFDDPYEATRVSSFMDEADLGRWQIKHFTVDGGEVQGSVARVYGVSRTAEERAMRMARIVPTGDYVSLRRRIAPGEVDEDGTVVYEDGSDFDGWVPVMSDTPAEVQGHDEVIQNATGRVLITGLGLGVVVSALLAKPEVEHITVVEIDRDVIGLTGHYYSNHPKVTLVNDDALEFARTYKSNTGWVSPDRRFDFAWHDIWTHISYRNLDDSLAEHGISYDKMFDAYTLIAKRQGAWAWAEATEQGRIEAANTARRKAFIHTWRTGTPEEKVEVLIEGTIRDQIGSALNVDRELPDEVREFFESVMKLREWAEHIVAGNGLDIDKLERDFEEPDSPLAKPNAAEGANIARR